MTVSSPPHDDTPTEKTPRTRRRLGRGGLIALIVVGVLIVLGALAAFLVPRLVGPPAPDDAAIARAFSPGPAGGPGGPGGPAAPGAAPAAPGAAAPAAPAAPGTAPGAAPGAAAPAAPAGPAAPGAATPAAPGGPDGGPAGGPSGPGGPGGPGGRGGPGGVGPVLDAVSHGEFVLDQNSGSRVVDVQRGDVVSVTPNALTMRSTDGFTATYGLEPGVQMTKDGQTTTVSGLASGDQGLVVADRVGPGLVAQVVDVG